MSYTKEVLTIDSWQNGVADSATLGFSAINNCEIFETPGTLKLANASLIGYPTYAPDSLPIAFTEDTVGNVYFLTENGTLYRAQAGVMYGLQSGLIGAQDIKFYRDYVWVSYGNVSGIVGLYGPTTGAASWFGNLATGLSLSYKKFVVCQDDGIYMSNGVNIKYMTTFAPAAVFVAPTVTFSTTGWNLPGGFASTSGSAVAVQTISTMVEYGRNISIGTTTGNVYQWDRADTQLTDTPYTISSGYIRQMITKENRIYLTAGLIGDVYVGDGTNFQKVQKIKWRQRRPFNASTILRPNAIAISPTSTLLIGSSTGSDSFPSTSLHGVHEVSFQGANPTCFKQTISTGNTGQSQALSIGFVGASQGLTYIGWQDGSTYGIDIIGSSGAIYTTGYAESPLYQISTSIDKKTFSNLEIKLNVPLITGQSVSISFRNSLNGTYDNPRVINFTTMGPTNISFAVKAALADMEQIQAKVLLTSPAGVGLTNVELVNVTLW